VNIRAPHVQEEQLFDCYLAERAEEPLDPRLAEHLADCDACALRYTDLTQFMDGLGADAQADTDAVFTPDRLQAQQHAIARRLEHVGRAARIISFPGRFAGTSAFAGRYGAGHDGSGTPRAARRWVAGAAAAGLFFGAALGASFEWDWHVRSQPQLAASARETERPRLTPVATRGTSPAAVADDDAFLSELEVALERPQTRELQPFDAFTPHVREVRNTIR
jgi:hypothetical protein